MKVLLVSILLVQTICYSYAESSIEFSDIRNMFDSEYVKAAMCLIPDSLTNLFMNLTIRDIYELVKLSPQLEKMSNSTDDRNYDQLESLFKTNAPGFYAKAQNLEQQYKTQFDALPSDAQEFLINVAIRLTDLSNYDDLEKKHFDLVHAFFQDLYHNYTNLGSSQTAIVNFFPSVSHILGSSSFTNFLSACASATNDQELDTAGEEFGKYIIQHACDHVDAITRAKRYIQSFHF
uniref:Uncharacterized protein n=1 Tax=Acrobeloides nanus TaxID=290746 RepID=A0A914EDN9_9BILA